MAAVVGQSSYDGIWWLCLAILVVLVVAVVWLLYWLGKLPGEIAHGSGHPQAAAVTICGWLGLLLPPLWPMALVWAYITPAGSRPPPPMDLTGIGDALKRTSAQVADIERKIGKGTAS